MKAVRVTSENVGQIMLNLGITSDMLMHRPKYNLCQLTKSMSSCNGECEKYGLSVDRCSVGESRNGACVLYRLYNIVNGFNWDEQLYAPEHLIELKCEDI